jgi:hypothetical protein
VKASRAARELRSLAERVARGVAVVAPVVGSALLAWQLVQPMPACVVRCEASWRIDRELERTDPQLVVIGNSMARRDVDLRALAAGLGVRPGRAAMIAMPGSSPGAWYAALRYRLYGAGHAPDWVFVVGASRSLWITRPTSGADVTATLGLAGTEDPVVARIFAWGDAPWARLWARADLRKRMWRAAAVDGVASLARPALEVAAGVDVEEEFEAAVAVGPPRVANAFGGAVHGGEVGVAERIEDGYLPELARLVADHGGRLVLARVPPMHAENNVFLQENPAADDEVGAWAAANGVVWARMPGLTLLPEHYADPFHLTPEGAAAYTAALVEAVPRPD